MNIDGLVEAVSAGVVAAIGMGGVMRRYWIRREIRQQESFTRSVGRIVEVKVAELVARQAASEERQGRHLDRQDIAIAALRRDIKQIQRRIGD